MDDWDFPSEDEPSRPTRNRGFNKNVILLSAAGLLVVVVLAVVIILKPFGGKMSGDSASGMGSAKIPASEGYDFGASVGPGGTAADVVSGSLTVGNTVVFGRYEQDNNTANGSEPIEWIVLDRQGSRYMLISKNALDCRQFDKPGGTATWDQCTLRVWLNTVFLNAAFSPAEQSAIPLTKVDNSYKIRYVDMEVRSGGNDTMDRVYVLNYEEYWEKYFSILQQTTCIPTAYAFAQEEDHWGRSGPEDGCQWWTRSPDDSNGSEIYSPTNEKRAIKGSGNGIPADYQWYVRPVIWVY